MTVYGNPCPTSEHGSKLSLRELCPFHSGSYKDAQGCEPRHKDESLSPIVLLRALEKPCSLRACIIVRTQLERYNETKPQNVQHRRFPRVYAPACGPSTIDVGIGRIPVLQPTSSCG